MNKYFVTYKVQGYDKNFKAGPYLYNEVEVQANDIREYEGVYDVQIIALNEGNNLTESEE